MLSYGKCEMKRLLVYFKIDKKENIYFWENLFYTKCLDFGSFLTKNSKKWVKKFPLFSVV